MRAISAFTDNHVCMLCSQPRTALIARDIGRFYARDVKVVKTNLTSEMFKSSVKSDFLRKSRIGRHSQKNRFFFYFAKTYLLVNLFKEK